MNQTELKIIRKSLRFGDVSTIARETGYSTATVYTALKGHAMTDAAKAILAHAQLLINQRNERTKTATK